MPSIRSAILAGTVLALVAPPAAGQSRAPIPPSDWPAYAAPVTDHTWRLTSYAPEAPLAQAVPDSVDATLAFDFGMGVGTGGCNGFVAPVTFVEPDGIVFDHVAPILGACEGPASSVENGYFALLPRVARWGVAGDALDLFDTAGSRILGYTVVPVESLVGTWNVEGVLGPDGIQVDLTSMPIAPVAIEFADGHVNTTVGCNGVGGTYTQDGAAFSFTAGPATQMYCEGLMDAEAALRAALSDAVTVRSPGGIIELVDAAGYSRLIIGPTHPPGASPAVSPAG